MAETKETRRKYGPRTKRNINSEEPVKKRPTPISNEELENAVAAAGMDPDGQPTFIPVKFKLGEGAKVPEYVHVGDIGRDVICTEVEYNDTYDAYICHTGLYCESPKGTGAFGMTRSSIYKVDAYLANGVGLLDTFLYRGEICFIFKSRTSMEVQAFMTATRAYAETSFWKKLFGKVHFNDLFQRHLEYHRKHALNWSPYGPGDRLGQLVFMAFPETRVEVVEVLSDTERGEGGFGSTGK